MFDFFPLIAFKNWRAKIYYNLNAEAWNWKFWNAFFEIKRSEIFLEISCCPFCFTLTRFWTSKSWLSTGAPLFDISTFLLTRPLRQIFLSPLIPVVVYFLLCKSMVCVMTCYFSKLCYSRSLFLYFRRFNTIFIYLIGNKFFDD